MPTIENGQITKTEEREEAWMKEIRRQRRRTTWSKRRVVSFLRVVVVI